MKVSVCTWHVEKEISHPAPMFVFPPSIFVVVKTGEQNGLCIFVGPKTRCKEIKKIGNQWMPFEVFLCVATSIAELQVLLSLHSPFSV